MKYPQTYRLTRLSVRTQWIHQAPQLLQVYKQGQKAEFLLFTKTHCNNSRRINLLAHRATMFIIFHNMGMLGLLINHTKVSQSNHLRHHYSGAVGRRPPFDEWPFGSMCRLWLWLMRCMTALRLIQVMETYGHFGSVRFYVQQPCVTDIMQHAGNGARRPVIAGRETNKLMRKYQERVWIESSRWMLAPSR